MAEEPVAVLPEADVVVDTRTRAERLLSEQRLLLEQILTAEPLRVVLEGLVRVIERHEAGGARGSVLLIGDDGRLRTGASPSLPAEYNAQVDRLAPTPGVGSCGTAVQQRRTVIVADVEQDPLWESLRDIAADAGIRACWSVPLISGDEVLGTLALYFPQPRTPTPEEMATAASCARIATLAIERHRAGVVAARADEANRTAARNAHRLTGLAEVGLQMADAQTVEEVVAIVTTRGLALLGADAGAVSVRDDVQDVVRLALSETMQSKVPLEEWVQPLDGPLPASRVARTGEPLFLTDHAAGVAWNPAMAGVHETTGREAWAAMPLWVSDRLLGALVVGWENPKEFPDEEIELLRALASQCAQTLDRIQRLAAERTAAIEVRKLSEALQRSQLSSPPEWDGLEVQVRYRPAAHEAQIGGDWYDAFRTRSDAMVLAIGDVSGHDRDAAATMAQIRTLLRAAAYDRDEGPAATLGRLDRMMAGLGFDTLATAAIVRLEPPAPGSAPETPWIARWASAGHLPPLLLRPDGEVVVLETPDGLLLGLDPSQTRSDVAVALPPGSVLVLYTDGLVERRDSSLGEGIAHLQRSLSEVAGPDLPEMCDHLLERLLPQAPEDDVALLALRVRTAPSRGTLGSAS